MATRFTPGPWHYDDHMVYGGPKMEYVCEVSGAASNEFHKANAALISAAPEMYEALEEALNALCGPQGYKGTDTPEGCAREKIRAALAKARGGA